jgi:hypothetical protein
MTPGILPSAAPPPATLFAPLLRRSAKKVTKKARHRTRCRAACAAGCPALLGTANGSAGSTKPAIPGLHRGRMLASCCFGFCGRMPPKRAPYGAARARREKPEGWRAGCAPVRCQHKDVPSANRRSALAHLEGRRPGRRAIRGVLSLVTFFAQAAQAKKVTRSPEGSGSLRSKTSKSRERSRWIPACAGMTSKGPSAGMTCRGGNDPATDYPAERRSEYRHSATARDCMPR